jgi:hypothetical protein
MCHPFRLVLIRLLTHHHHHHQEWDYHIFQPHLSAPLGPNDTITTLNLPLLGALELLHAYR